MHGDTRLKTAHFHLEYSLISFDNFEFDYNPRDNWTLEMSPQNCFSIKCNCHSPEISKDIRLQFKCLCN